jgi:hypothetical protein
VDRGCAVASLFARVEETFCELRFDGVLGNSAVGGSRKFVLEFSDRS